MTTTAAVLLVVVLLLVFLAFKMPVWIALVASGAIGLFILRDESFVTNSLGSIPFDQTSTFSLTIVPMFILMGTFAVKANIAEQVFAVAQRAFRRLPGGLGISTVAACAGFAAVSGSTIGTAATMANLSVNQMRKAGYPTSLASALVAVAGTLGAMIPPSVFLVLYAILAGESIGEMLAAGIVPGLLSAVAYSIYIFARTRKMTLNPIETAGSGGDLDDELEAARGASHRVKTKNRRSAGLPYRGIVRLAILFLIIMGGIYTGLFTPTESAAIGALAAALMLVLEYRGTGLRNLAARFVEALKETARTTSMVFAIIVGSAMLSLFFVVARVPQSITHAVTSLDLPGWMVLAILLALLIPLGMALESISILVITVPLLYPVAMELGFDGVWLGILIVKLIEIGMVTPPVGINAFVVAGTAGVKSSEVFKGVWPFVVIEIGLVAVLFLVPQLSLWLPSMVVQ